MLVVRDDDRGIEKWLTRLLLVTAVGAALFSTWNFIVVIDDREAFRKLEQEHIALHRKYDRLYKNYDALLSGEGALYSIPEREEE